MSLYHQRESFEKILTLAARGDSIAAWTSPGTSTVDKAMKSSRSQSRKRRKSIIDSIRRPIAPPGHPLTHAKPDEKARPAGRKAKHKHRPQEQEMEEEH
jgi:hypothetical protein